MKSQTRRDLQEVNKRIHANSERRFHDVLLQLCRTHKTSYSERIVELSTSYLAGDQRSALELLDLADSLSSTAYDDETVHYVSNQFAALIKKYPFSLSKDIVDPEQVAYRKFTRSEQQCSRFNKLFKGIGRRESKTLPPSWNLDSMRSFITYVIGERPRMDSIFDKCGFGPGANVGIHGNATHVKRKLSSMWSVSSGAFDFARLAVISHAQMRELLLPAHRGFLDGSAEPLVSFGTSFREKVRIVEHNNISFVPKTTKTFRSIAVEPVLNSFVQKGVDEELRSLLCSRALIDLTDQQKNSEMAREGSFDLADSFVTIDLSSASDSISIELCREVLPPDWFYLLDRVRSKSFKYNGQVQTYSKFCSMGNGFCFPLQTLLFASICNAVGAGRSGIDFRVYGDDIVVKKEYAFAVIGLLRQCGFRTNKDKTFISGPFRESCGKDYYRGVNVRPVYLDYRLDSVGAIFKFYNSTLRVSEKSAAFFAGVRTFLFDSIPARWRFVRPIVERRHIDGFISGAAESAFDVDVAVDLFVASSHVRFNNRTWSFSWRELSAEPVVDRIVYNELEEYIAVLYGALMGLPAHKMFTLRRETKAKVRLASHGVAMSTWLPPSIAL